MLPVEDEAVPGLPGVVLTRQGPLGAYTNKLREVLNETGQILGDSSKQVKCTLFVALEASFFWYVIGCSQGTQCSLLLDPTFALSKLCSPPEPRRAYPSQPGCPSGIRRAALCGSASGGACRHVPSF